MYLVKAAPVMLTKVSRVSFGFTPTVTFGVEAVTLRIPVPLK
jgi:hypothetical protein